MKRFREEERPRVLILRALKLGDLLVAVPALRGLRRAFPEHELVFAAPGWLDLIVRLTEAVDRHVPTRGLDDPLPLGPEGIELAVNLHGNGPESRARLEQLGVPRVLGYRVQGYPGPEWDPSLHERERWTALLASAGIPADPEDVQLRVPDADETDGPVLPGAIVIHAGAFHGARHWPVDRFGHVARWAARLGRPVVVTGSAAERPRAEAIAVAAGLPQHAVVAGQHSLIGLAAQVSSASIVISADTGTAHLASAYRTPSVVLFGPAEPEVWGPPVSGPHRVLTDASLRRGDVFADDPDPALLAVTEGDVIRAATSLMAEAGLL